MTVLTAAGPVTPRPLLLDAYGSYGISTLPSFNARQLAFVDGGGTAVECSVRGGGPTRHGWETSSVTSLPQANASPETAREAP